MGLKGNKGKIGWIIVLGLVVRVWFVFASNHIYYPDEIFQSLEQSHRMVYGYGIVPWDYIYGLRSHVLPLFLAGPLWILKTISMSTPGTYTVGMKLFLASLSLVLIPAAYVLMKTMTGNIRMDFLAAFVMAVWYELVYFSPRALTELMSVYCFAAAVLAFYWGKKGWLVGFLSVLAMLFRIHYGIIFLVWSLVVWREKAIRKQLIFGGAAAVIMYGLVDWYYYQKFLYSLFANVRLSFLAGISEVFGTKPWDYYAVNLLIGSAGLLLFAGYVMKQTKLRHPLALCLFALWLTHSLMAHKEYRFLFAAIPLWLLLVVWGLKDERFKVLINKHIPWVYAVFILISAAGFMNLLPLQSTVYNQQMLQKDPQLLTYIQIAGDHLTCGLMDTDRTWVFSGGYYYLHLPIPIYSDGIMPPNSQAVSHVLIEQNDWHDNEFIKTTTSQPYTVTANGQLYTVHGMSLYKRIDNNCSREQPDYQRSFEDVETILQKTGARPVLKGFIKP